MGSFRDQVVAVVRARAKVHLAAIDPVASMQAIQNPKLVEKAQAIRTKLERVVQVI